jgi:predicted CopG family antitoxin
MWGMLDRVYKYIERRGSWITLLFYTHIHTQMDMGAKNISISDEAYTRLASMKAPNESFTDVINRLTGKKSILELAGILTEGEGDEMRRVVAEVRVASGDRASKTMKRMASA